MFPLPTLAALAGRRPLGGEREVVLAALVCAHLAAGLPRGTAVPGDACARRAAGARAWLAAMAVPAPVRTACVRLIDATAHGDPAALRTALRGVIEALGRSLDPSAKRELERLASIAAPTATP